MVAFPGIQMVESNASGLEMYCDNNSLSRETGICALAHYIFISALWTMRKNESNSLAVIVMLIETCYGFLSSTLHNKIYLYRRLYLFLNGVL
jgi:hypothetical protein